MSTYVVVGSGIFGSVFAHEMAKQGHKITVLEKKNHIAGNMYTQNIAGIEVHQYGAHIFHTSDKQCWEYIQQFAEFNQYINSPLAYSKGKLYNLPFNMNTFYQLWGVKTPAEAKRKLQSQRSEQKNDQPANLEEQAISLVGKDVYETLIKEYTEKQWGRSCDELPAFIIKRLPVRFTFDNNYFNDRYQGIPIGGYTQIIEKMLTHPNITLHLETDFFHGKEKWLTMADKVLFTGMIDEFYDYCYGELAYRSLAFDHQLLQTESFQGNAVVNYIDKEVPYTRIIEHKHFEFGDQEKTVITKEYPKNWKRGSEPYYPINDQRNDLLYRRYKELAEKDQQILFGGRLGMYRYFDMHQAIQSSLELVRQQNYEQRMG